MRAKSVFPLQRGGAAEQMVRLLGQKGNVTVQDLTALPRFGLKGPGSAEWLQATGLILPAVNRHARIKASRSFGSEVTTSPVSKVRGPRLGLLLCAVAGRPQPRPRAMPAGGRRVGPGCAWMVPASGILCYVCARLICVWGDLATARSPRRGLLILTPCCCAADRDSKFCSTYR